MWGIARQTIYNWLSAFLDQSWDSLNYRFAPGRPPRFTKTQKEELYTWVKERPEACGFASGCWTTILIQELIWKKFGVLYNRFYVSELLHNLGLSYQKAHFVSDHLDEEARQHWMKEEWPKILSRARQIRAPVFFPFITDRSMRNIIGQPHNTIDLRQAMNKGQILFVNLSKGDLGEANSSLLGAVLVNLVLIAALQRRSG